SANRYNSELSELLPAQLGKVESIPDSGASWRIGEHDTNTAVFGAFRLPNNGNLALPEFRTRLALTPVPGSSSLAFFDDDVPLLVSRRLGKGQIALVNTSADTAWGDWPKHKTFVPWIHGLGRFLVQKAGREAGWQTNSFVVDEDFELEASGMVGKSQLRLRGPEGREAQLTFNEQGRLQNAVLTTPGIYSLLDKSGHE